MNRIIRPSKEEPFYAYPDDMGFCDGSIHNNLINAVKAKETKAILECHSITGGGSHILKVRVKSSQALEDLLYEIQNWPGVSRTQSNVVLSTYKETMMNDLITLMELHNIT